MRTFRGYASLIVETENTFLQEHLKDVSVMPTLNIYHRTDADFDCYGRPEFEEISIDKITICRMLSYTTEELEIIRDTVDAFEEEIKDLFTCELAESWDDYCNDYDGYDD